MADFERLLDLSDEWLETVSGELLKDFTKGNTMISASRTASILGCRSETITNAAREGRLPFGFCHRSESAKSFTTVVLVPKLAYWLGEHRKEKKVS